jgi:hypothetical protein
MGGQKGEGFELSNHTLKQKILIISTLIEIPLRHGYRDSIYHVHIYISFRLTGKLTLHQPIISTHSL